MAIRTTCPHCHKTIVSPDQLGGEKRQCPHCSEWVAVPRPDAVASPVLKPTQESSDSEHSPDPFARKPKREFHDLIDMTAMVDIVFFLLIFFLVTSFVSLSAAIQAPSAESTLGKTARNPSDSSLQPVVVRIDEDGIIWLDQDPIQGVHDLTVRLRAAKDETGADGLRIAANPEATHGKVVMVLDAGISAGFEKAQLAVEELP